jgi:DnaJ like chaperone protein
MKFLGKIIGLILGWALTRHPIGMAFGVAIGHAFDKGFFDQWLPAPIAREGSFVGPLFALAGAIAKADGRVSEREVAAAEKLMDRLNLDARQRKRAIREFNRGKEERFNVHLAARELRSFCGFRGELKLMLLEVLTEVALADGALQESRRDVLSRVARSLDLSDDTLAWLIEKKRPPGPRAPDVGNNPYAILGLTRAASDDEIRRAYRTMISQVHPDKLPSGASAEAVREAESQAAAINAAYEQVKTLRGM